MRVSYSVLYLTYFTVYSVSSLSDNKLENAPSFPLPLLEFSDVASMDKSTSAQLLYTLSNLGIVAISNIPGYKEARIQALSDLENNCLIDTNGADIQTSTYMIDGSMRRTAGTSTKSGKPDRLSMKSISTCDKTTSLLRSLVDLTSRALFNSLDLAIGRKQQFNENENSDQNIETETASSSLMDSSKGFQYNSFDDLINNAEHLEHFHQYESTQHKNENNNNEFWSPALNMHTDSGLLIGMTNGFQSSSNNDKKKNGLYIELPQGGIYHAECPDDTLIFMVGQGGASWLNSNSGLKLRAVPHALVLPWQQQPPSSSEKNEISLKNIEKQWRSWYGRMFLPPRDALIDDGSSTMVSFEELKSRQKDIINGKTSYPSIGCDHGPSSSSSTSNVGVPTWLRTRSTYSRVTTASNESTNVPVPSPTSNPNPLPTMPMDDDCNSNEVLCWMQCMDASSMSCGAGTSIACYDEGSHEVVEGDIMCPTGTENCDLQCVANSELLDPVKHTGFCYGVGTDMYMDGFTSYVNNDETPLCLNLLFTDWTLNTKTKFTFACIGIILLGIFTELLGLLRRLIDTFIRQGGLGKYKRAGPLIMSTLYGTQVLLGYFLMLTAMTYQVELFVCVLLGLVMGHAAFNLNETPSANTDPCCVNPVESKPSFDGKGLHTALPIDYEESKITGSPMYQQKEGPIILVIDGMTCNNCTTTVTNALQKHRGVYRVEVSLSPQQAIIYPDVQSSTESFVKSLIATIESVGFDARV